MATHELVVRKYDPSLVVSLMYDKAHEKIDVYKTGNLTFNFNFNLFSTVT